MPRIVLPSAAATALLAMTLAPGSAAAFPEDCAYGVNAHQVSNDALDLAADAGIAWVRFDMNWHQFEPSPGSFNWTQADRFIDHATANGQHVFVTIAYTPQWAVGAAWNAPPWAAGMSAVGRRGRRPPGPPRAAVGRRGPPSAVGRDEPPWAAGATAAPPGPSGPARACRTCRRCP